MVDDEICIFDVRQRQIYVYGRLICFTKTLASFMAVQLWCVTVTL